MTRPNWLTPVVTVFITSLALSLAAWLGSTVNRDGMLYVNTAQAYLDGDFAAAKALFSWPFLPIVMAWISKLFGLPPESAGYLVNALFMAGTCALMIDCVHREKPELTWIACVTVLALPGLNGYRNELLREYGCWFFIMLSFWLALKWSNRPSWLTATGIHASLICASLFRPEALTLFAALVAWQLSSSANRDWRRLAMIALFPLIGGTLLIVLYCSGQLGSERIANEIGRLSLTRFETKADILANALIEYARSNARKVLFFGSLALIPIKLIEKFSVFIVPLYFYFSSRKPHGSGTLEPLLLCGIITHLLVLSVFVTDLQFLAGRYVGPILLFSTPFIASGLKYMFGRWPILPRPTLVVAIVMALANVVSTGPGKAHFAEAGAWLADNAPTVSRVYIDSGRTAYHAHWQSISTLQSRNDLQGIAKAIRSGNYDLFVLERSRKDDPITNLLERELHMTIVARFGHRDRDEVIIARPGAEQ